MNTVTGIIINLRSQAKLLIDRTPMKQLHLNLGDSSIWRIGIDPASRYTGLALMDTNKQYVILLDCKRDVILPNDDFYNDLYYLLKRLVTGKKVERIVNEKPFVKGGYVRASEVLIALRGKIEIWVKNIPELNLAEFAQIPPNVWKSRVINKSKGKNRFRDKKAVAEDLCDIFPLLREYYNKGYSGDLDSFDALGALIGYEMYAYTENGTKKISGSKEKTHHSLVGYKWVAESEVDESFVQNTLGLMSQITKPIFLEYNTDYSFADNVTMATSNNDATVTIIPANQLQQFQWKFGIDITKRDHLLIMFAFRKGHFTPSECSSLKNKFEMHEEFGGV